MKLRLFFTLSLLAAALGSVTVLPANAAPKKATKVARRSVLDYFQLLPARFFAVDDRRVLLGKSYLPVVDLKNDYLRTGGDAGQPSLEVAVFRYRGRDLVAVSAAYEMGNDFALLRLENGRWKNVTGALSPMPNKPSLRFQLPRYGTTIQVFTESGAPLVKLFWSQGRFQGRFSGEGANPRRPRANT